MDLGGGRSAGKGEGIDGLGVVEGEDLPGQVAGADIEGSFCDHGHLVDAMARVLDAVEVVHGGFAVHVGRGACEGRDVGPGVSNRSRKRVHAAGDKLVRPLDVDVAQHERPIVQLDGRLGGIRDLDPGVEDIDATLARVAAAWDDDGRSWSRRFQADDGRAVPVVDLQGGFALADQAHAGEVDADGIVHDDAIATADDFEVDVAGVTSGLADDAGGEVRAGDGYVVEMAVLRGGIVQGAAPGLSPRSKSTFAKMEKKIHAEFLVGKSSCRSRNTGIAVLGGRRTGEGAVGELDDGPVVGVTMDVGETATVELLLCARNSIVRPPSRCRAEYRGCV